MKNIDTKELQLMHDPEYTMLTKVHENLYLSKEQIEILEEYNIDYKSCKSINDLIYIIEDIISECDDVVLLNLVDILAERDYYENYNK